MNDRVAIARSGYLLAAGISFVLSVILWFTDNREEGLFVGLWVPSILSLGALLIASQGRR